MEGVVTLAVIFPEGCSVFKFVLPAVVLPGIPVPRVSLRVVVEAVFRRMHEVEVSRP